MRILYRVDGNERIGFGHVRRVLSLMHVLSGNKQYVLLGGGVEETRRLFEAQGTECRVFNSQRPGTRQLCSYANEVCADVLVVDLLNNQYPDSFFSSLQKCGRPVLAIDDCGNKRIDADVVVNGTLVPEWLTYPQSKARLFLGPKFMILGEELSVFHRKKKRISSRVEIVSVTTGGSDWNSLSAFLVGNLLRYEQLRAIHVFEGPYYSEKVKNALKKFYGNPRVVVHRATGNIFKTLFDSDLVFLSAGVTAYECACLGTPFATVNQVEHQNHTADAFEAEGACVNLGVFGEGFAKSARKIRDCIYSSECERRKMSERAKKLVDGRGAMRVKKILEALAKSN